MKVTCGLTAKKPGSAPCLMLVIEYESTSLFNNFFEDILGLGMTSGKYNVKQVN